MIDIIITLYHAEWCGHCKIFKPIWKDLKKKVIELKKDGTLETHGINNIIFKDFTDSQIQGKPEIEKQVNGFPTIVVTNNGKNIKYDGKRTVDDILQFIYDSNVLAMTLTESENNEKPTMVDQNNDFREMVAVGGSNVNYKQKYHKYKTMYAELVDKYKKLKNENT
jgi:thiol-disulfide isomerase/thioredoxin